jgi:uncharacterized membrane protein YgcG
LPWTPSAHVLHTHVLPVAHLSMQELVDQLDGLCGGVGEMSANWAEVTRLANTIAVRTGASQARMSTTFAIAAACRMLGTRRASQAPKEAIKGLKTSAQQCRTWVQRIQSELDSERAAGAGAGGGAGTSGAASSMGSGSAGGGGAEPQQLQPAGGAAAVAVYI